MPQLTPTTGITAINSPVLARNSERGIGVPDELGRGSQEDQPSREVHRNDDEHHRHTEEDDEPPRVAAGGVLPFEEIHLLGVRFRG